MKNENQNDALNILLQAREQERIKRAKDNDILYTIEITNRERDIIQCFIDSWAKYDMGLYGHITFQDAYGLCLKLNLEVPVKLMDIMDGTFEREMCKIFDEDTLTVVNKEERNA